MSGTVKLTAPSYLPTLFAPASSDASLLSALSGNRAEETAVANPVAGLEQARTEQAAPGVAPRNGAAQQNGDGGTANAALDLTIMTPPPPDLVV
jgi:hypothetical protein